MLIWRFKNERKILELRVIDYPAQSLEADMPLTDSGMAVLVGGRGIEAVIEVNRFQSSKTDYPVEFVENSIKVADYIVSGIGDMAGIEADAQLFTEIYLVDDCSDFFKSPADFTAFSGHCFQQYYGSLLRVKDGV